MGGLAIAVLTFLVLWNNFYFKKKPAMRTQYRTSRRTGHAESRIVQVNISEFDKTDRDTWV